MPAVSHATRACSHLLQIHGPNQPFASCKTIQQHGPEAEGMRTPPCVSHHALPCHMQTYEEHTSARPLLSLLMPSQMLLQGEQPG